MISLATLCFDGLGWVGAAAVTIPYTLVSIGRMQGTSFAYRALNLIGGVCLALNTAYHHAYPSVVVNIIWTMIGIYAFASAAKTRA